MLKKRTVTAWAVLGLAALAPAVLAVDFTIDWSTIDGGGGYSAGGDFELEGTIGQHDAGPSTGEMTGGDFALTGGFWPGTTVSLALPGDCDGDGDVDLDDFADFNACLVGPDGGLGTGCECFDFDDDGDNDLNDFAEFQVNFTGP